MNTRYLTALAVLPGLAWAPTSGFAQASELDLTMQVIAENQEPAGFINQIDLPPPEFFVSGTGDLEVAIDAVIEDQVAETTAVVDDVETTAADAIREQISIDGVADTNGTGAGNNDSSIPDSVDTILASDLPFDGTLQETVDATSDLVDGVTDSVGQVTGSVDAGVDTIVDVTDATNDAVGSGTNAVTDIVDNLGDATDDNLDAASDALGSTTDAATVQVMELNDSLQNIDDQSLTVDDAVVDNLSTLDADVSTGFESSLGIGSDSALDDGLLTIQGGAEQLTESGAELQIDTEQLLPTEGDSNLIEDDLAPSIENLTDSLPGN